VVFSSRSEWFGVSNSRAVTLIALDISWLVVPIFLMVPGFISAQDRAGEPTNTEEEYSVVLFTGGGKDTPFWNLFEDFMREAASDLGMQLEVYYADGSRKRMATQIHTVCQRADKPDGIVFHLFKLNGPNILRIAEQYGIPVFLVNAGLSEKQRNEIGMPRTKLRHWLGEMLPDDDSAGYKLANALIDEAKKDPRRLGPDGRVHVIALNGTVSDSASIQRVAGLNRAIAERGDEATLEQVVAADWDEKMARKRCRFLHRRYPHAKVVWSASDLMAAGAIAAMEDRGLTPGKDVIIGGVDAATPEIMELIEQGKLYATVGGHFMEGGWVAVLLHDFLHGVDLDQIKSHYDSPMTLVTKDNLANYRAKLFKSTWERMDFRQLSRIDSPELKTYRFGPQVLPTIDPPLDVPSTPSNEGDTSKVADGDKK
jgi:ABC-type sugar transport system substrate-binding protein